MSPVRDMSKPSPLFVIEAPGKVRVLRRSLRKLGMHAEVVCTKGHFVAFPERLRPLGITSDYQPIGLRANPAVVRRLQALARDADVFIATDDDQEGHRIAVDVYQHIKAIARRTVRLPLRDISMDGVRQVLERAAPVAVHTGRPAGVRRIVDRLIGYSYSRQGIACGRVSSALLSVTARHAPIIGHVVLSLPAADGGEVFACRMPVTRETLSLWRYRQRLLWDSQPARVMKVAGKRTSPLNYAGLMQHVLARHHEVRA